MAGLTTRNGTYYITDRDERGRVKKRSTRTKNRQIAEAKLRQYEHEKQLGTVDVYRQHRRAPIQQHISDFHAYQLAEGITPAHAGAARKQIERIVADAKIKTIADITDERITASISVMRRLKSPHTIIAATTRNHYKETITAFCNWLYQNRRVGEPIIRRIKQENPDTDVRHARTALTQEQFTALYETARRSTEIIESLNGETRARAYLISACSGLRRGEVASLTPRSFSFSPHFTVMVEAAYSKRRKRDVIHLPAELADEFKTWLEPLESDEKLFPGLKTKRTAKMVRMDLAAANIAYQDEQGRYRDWHALRHSYITNCWKSGASPAVIQKLARHSSLALTIRYSHVRDEDLREAVERTPRMLA